MKKASELVSLDNLPVQPLKKPPSLSESKTYDDVLLKRMFVTFSIFYGASWDKNMATEQLAKITKTIWVKALSGLTREQIESGLDKLHGTFAINPSEFRQLCGAKDALHNTAAYLPFERQKQLEAPRNKLLAKSKLSEMRRILKGNRNIDVVANHD